MDTTGSSADILSLPEQLSNAFRELGRYRVEHAKLQAEVDVLTAERNLWKEKFYDKIPEAVASQAENAALRHEIGCLNAELLRTHAVQLPAQTAPGGQHKPDLVGSGPQKTGRGTLISVHVLLIILPSGLPEDDEIEILETSMFVSGSWMDSVSYMGLTAS